MVLTLLSLILMVFGLCSQYLFSPYKIHCLIAGAIYAIGYIIATRSYLFDFLYERKTAKLSIQNPVVKQLVYNYVLGIMMTVYVIRMN